MGADNSETHNSAEHVERNREAWDVFAQDYVEPGHRAWQGGIHWGIWDIPEEQLHLLPEVSGLNVVELGCGTAYVSAWLARKGARVVGIDISREQLKTARALQDEFRLFFSLIQTDAERVPLCDASFDLAISEYGASVWCDPYRWIPEAARLLRPEGSLVFLSNSTILMLCAPDEDDVPAESRLLRDYFGMHRFEWPNQKSDQKSVEFHLGYGDWVKLFRANNFVIEDLIELRPPEGASTRYPFVTSDWARRWPSEQVWKLRRLPKS